MVISPPGRCSPQPLFDVNKVSAINQDVNAGSIESLDLSPSNHITEMSDELLGDIHPFKKLLEEAVSKTLLNGGDVLLHVLQAPEDGERRGVNMTQQETQLPEETKTW